MEEILMSPEEISEEIKFEDDCGVNTLLQNLINRKDKVNVFKKIECKCKYCGKVKLIEQHSACEHSNGSYQDIRHSYVIRDKITGEDVQY